LKCPVCHEPMIVVEYQSIELDYCSSCHGTWFDKGELELLLRSMELDEKPGLLEMPYLPASYAKALHRLLSEDTG